MAASDYMLSVQPAANSLQQFITTCTTLGANFQTSILTNTGDIAVFISRNTRTNISNNSHKNKALSCKTLGIFANKPEHAETVLLNSSMHAYALQQQLLVQSNHKNAMQSWHYTLLHNCNQSRVCQVSRISTHRSQEAYRVQREFTVFSDESIELQDLSLDLPTSLLEKKPPLSLLFTKSSSRSKEGRDDQQMLPEVLNKAFSTKSTQYIMRMP